MRLWNVATGKQHGEPLGHNREVWDVEVKSLIADACRIANRNLCRDEWSRFVARGFDYARTCSSLPAGEGAT